MAFKLRNRSFPKDLDYARSVNAKFANGNYQVVVKEACRVDSESRRREAACDDRGVAVVREPVAATGPGATKEE